MNSTSIALGCTPGGALGDDTRLIVEDATPGQALDPLAMGGHLPDSYYDPLLVKRLLSNPKIQVLVINEAFHRRTVERTCPLLLA